MNVSVNIRNVPNCLLTLQTPRHATRCQYFLRFTNVTYRENGYTYLKYTKAPVNTALES